MHARVKLKAKTELTETKVILGWLLNFQQMAIAFPKKKTLAYSTTINETLDRGWISIGKLEMNIGR